MIDHPLGTVAKPINVPPGTDKFLADVRAQVQAHSNATTIIVAVYR
ncbi:MAG: hypothetical protein QM662_02705 [Gordonia sp. (in: high G+C Gram-positive bacteria)]